MRVVIADDHQLLLNGLKGALEKDGGFEVVGATQSGAEVVALVASTRPELVVLDARMPAVDGLTCLAEIKKRFPDTKVVMLSASSSRDMIDAALRAGASAWVNKSVDPSDLPSTLRQAVSGTVFTAIGVEDTAGATAGAAATLTEREVAILRALARGLSNDEIAKELWVTQQTVKFHLTNIYRKTGTKNRTDAARYAFQHRIAESPHRDDD